LADKALFDDMRARFDNEIVRLTPREFVAAKLSERDARIARAGASRYLVEPNIKEGKGGLRDLNTLFWIAKYVYRVDDPEELVEAGLFTAKEFHLFRRCEKFLVAGALPVAFRDRDGRRSGSPSIASGRSPSGSAYVTHAGLSDVERFMKHYFLSPRRSAI